MATCLNVLDLFSGIGGFSLGLERTGGFQTVAFCEVDKAARKVLQKNWPEVPILPDVSTLTREDVQERVDVICGGFPCQDISAAWDGPGLEGSRSGLWGQYFRIIREFLPKYILIENVANLRKRGLDVVLENLREIGYKYEWAIIKASDVGAPHERKRLWIIAWREWSPVVALTDCLEGEEPGEAVCPRCFTDYADCPCPGPHSEDGWTGFQDSPVGPVAYPDLSGCREQRGPSTVPQEYPSLERDCWWEAEPGLDMLADGVPARVERVKQCGNAVVPQIPELIGYAILNHERSCNWQPT